ncbi:MAG: hypothetical protein HOP12_09545 [Candidatus Eisenbacteria bacterium]|uniref:DinB-like domain-containing protein n=1 Tax=Eiseniibacteriota bacterium TaxID=2212470 RepID=A0A849SSP6_UNCEI|nr:hypothetical protein [Candidatus Eisenbacteria bacterium]
MSDRAQDWPARLALHPSAFIAPSAIVTGEVSLGARASVWFHTVVRGDTAAITVGDETNLQDGTIVHVDAEWPTVLGARVTVGHRAVVHGCTIGDDCLIGMGAVVLSGARIGAGSLIGAGALVREGQEIAAGSLAVGAPARVVGPTTPTHREAMRRGNAHYVTLSRSYLRRGFARPHPEPGSDLGTATPWRGPVLAAEWDALVTRLAEAPKRVESLRARTTETHRWTSPPGPDRWSAAMVLAHLRDVDREVFRPRVERMLTEVEPEIENQDAAAWAVERGYAATGPFAALSAWGLEREALVARLWPLRREALGRLAWHSVRGPVTLGDMVRNWVEHDASHLRQLAAALEGQP